MNKYVLHPGIVVSKSDGDKHFISAARLCALYRVKWEECVVAKPNWWHGFTQKALNELIHLAPDYTGEYKIAQTNTEEK